MVDEAGYRALPASVQTYRAALALVQGDLDRRRIACPGGARRWPRPRATSVRAAAGALGGLASWTMGDLDSAHVAYTESVAGLARVGFVADVLGCSITLGDIRRTQGGLGDALRTYRTALELATPEPGAAPYRGTADMHVGIAGVLVERDELSGAQEQLAIAERLGEYNGLPQNPYRSRVVAAQLRQAEGDLDGALGLLDEAVRLYNGDYSPNVQPVPAVRARLWVRRGELREAAEWAREPHLPADDDLSYLREYEHITLARLLLARHEHRRRFSRAGPGDGPPGTAAGRRRGGRAGRQRPGNPCPAGSFAPDAQGPSGGDRGAAPRRHARAAGGHVRVFANEGEPMAELLRTLTRRRKARATCVNSWPLPFAVARIRPVPQGGLIEPLSERELDVLRLLATDLDGPDIARRLHVSLNTMRTHSRSIFRKLQVNNRRAAVRQAAELDLLPRQTLSG